MCKHCTTGTTVEGEEIITLTDMWPTWLSFLCTSWQQISMVTKTKASRQLEKSLHICQKCLGEEATQD